MSERILDFEKAQLSELVANSTEEGVVLVHAALEAQAQQAVAEAHKEGWYAGFYQFYERIKQHGLDDFEDYGDTTKYPEAP